MARVELIPAIPIRNDSNTYISLEEADKWLCNLPYASAWNSLGTEDADIDKKKSALIYATRILDNAFVWKGSIYNVYEGEESNIDNVPRQNLNFPRFQTPTRNPLLFEYQNNTVPLDLALATAEYANFLLSQDLPLIQETGANVNRIKIGEIDIDLARGDNANRVRAIPQWIVQRFDYLFSASKFTGTKLRAI